MKRLAGRIFFGLFVAVLWIAALMLGVVFWGRWESESALVSNPFIQARFGAGEWPLTAESALDPAKLDLAEREAWIGPGKSIRPLPLTPQQERQRWLERARYFADLPDPLRYTFARMYRVDVYGVDDRGLLVARYPEALDAPGLPASEVLSDPIAGLLLEDPGDAAENPIWMADPTESGDPPWVILFHNTTPYPPDPHPHSADTAVLFLLAPRPTEWSGSTMWDSEYFAMRPYYVEDDPPPGPGQPRGAFIAINNVGLRDYDLILPKPSHVCRVLCVGASTTYEGMHNLLTYPVFMEYLLNRQARVRRVDVINGGVSGMNSTKHRVKLADYLFLQPDVAVFYLGVNDVMHIIYPTMKIWLDGARQLLSLRPVKRLLWRIILPDEEEIDRRIHQVQENLKATAEGLKTRGVKVVFCTFAAPDPAYLSREERVYLEYCIEKEWGGDQCSYAAYYYLLSRYNLGISHMAAELNVPLIPVAESLREGLAFFGDICHMRNAGIERKARIIAEALKPLIEKCLAEEDVPAAGTPKNGSPGN